MFSNVFITVENLSPGTTYVFKVYAFRDNGEFQETGPETFVEVTTKGSYLLLGMDFNEYLNRLVNNSQKTNIKFIVNKHLIGGCFKLSVCYANVIFINWG